MKSLIFVLCVTVLISCNKTIEREVTFESYEEFLEIYDSDGDGIIVSDIEDPEDPGATEGNYKELNEYFGVFDETKLNSLLKIELETFTKAPGINLGKSGVALPGDSIKTAIRSCGTFDASDSTAIKMYNKNIVRVARYAPRTYDIPLAIHVISESDTEWTPSEKEIKEQVAILNDAFKPILISFTDAIIKYHVNPEWNLAYRTEWGNHQYDKYYDDMVNSISEDNNKYINIYINGCDLLGQASLPFSVDYRSNFDNVVINKNSFNGRINNNSKDLMEGKTLVHEMGHFFGLLHTFHSDIDASCGSNPYDGCSGSGDLVDDTPPQRYCHDKGCGSCSDDFGCENCEEQSVCDTCPADDFKDPVNNFMGYNPDSCMNEFTPGQYNRMQTFFMKSRFYLSETLAFLGP